MSRVPKHILRQLRNPPKPLPCAPIRPRLTHELVTDMLATGDNTEAVKLLQVPTRLDLAKHGAGHCKQFNVFFNGIRQTACTIADSELGEITRFKHMKGHVGIRVNGRDEVEVLKGDVRIEWRS